MEITANDTRVSNVLVSLGHTGRTVILDHTLNTQTLMKTKSSHNVLSKLTILCLASFIAILGCMWPMGHGLNTPIGKFRESFSQTMFGRTLIAGDILRQKVLCSNKLWKQNMFNSIMHTNVYRILS